MPPSIALQPGSTNTAAVKQLQDYLVSQGLMTQAQVNTGYGTYGPQTKAAVAALQARLGVNAGADAGYFGPKTIAAISTNSQPAQKAIPNPPQPKTQAELDTMYASAAAAHPAFAGNSPESLAYATSTGDYSALMNSEGQPFSTIDQTAAVSEATSALDPYYKALEVKDTQNTADDLAEKKRAYDEFLATQAQKFQTDKTTQDQTAADRGVLFSGGRVQKLKNLETSYNQADENKRASVGSDIATSARDFGYKYGDSAANNLSQYFNLGKNTYNANVATGGVGSGGLSSIYNANQGFQGTVQNTKKADIQKRAAGLLYNKGNKILSTGYTNQY